jgi:hypothetical protein
MPPGIAEKPEELVAPVLGEYQPPGVGWVVVLFNAPAATDEPPKKFSIILHSLSVGTCHPVGHKPLVSMTAKWLYNLPYNPSYTWSFS